MILGANIHTLRVASCLVQGCTFTCSLQIDSACRKLVNLEAELLYDGFPITSGVLHAFAPLSVPRGEASQHVWTSEPTDLELEEYLEVEDRSQRA